LLWDLAPLPLTALSETCHPLTAMLNATPYWYTALLQVPNPNKNWLNPETRPCPDVAIPGSSQ